MPARKKLLFTLPILCLTVNMQASAEARDYFDLSIEELMNVQVTSVSKKEEKASEAPAAIFVITQEDIQRTGATSIPEALRIAPGVQVARVGSNKWAISTRGFNDQLSNKLLVLIDGRTIYTPLFSGVNWDVQDTLLEDIERIEVIRGPGATLWGANAVNGVINIITKSSKDTVGNLATATVGSFDRGVVGARNGGKIDNNTYYRVYGKYFTRDEAKTLTGSDANDDWDSYMTGFRVDMDKTSDDKITVQGDVYNTTEDRNLLLPTLGFPFSSALSVEEKRRGGNILSRWTHKFSNTSESVLQVYYDNVQRDNPSTLNQTYHTFDVDFQHSFNINDRNEMVWGVGYRLIKDDLEDTVYLSYTPDDRQDNLYSAFIQNKFTVIPKELFLTVGSKFEINHYTGFEFQPNARLSWVVDSKQTVWSSVSRAVRTPNRSEDDVRLVAGVIPPGVLAPSTPAGFITQVGNHGFESEELTAYEVGYRVQPHETVFLDFATFYNDYDNMRTLDRGIPFSLPGVSIPLNVSNKGEAKSYGFETAANWRVMKNWELAASYTWLNIDTEINQGSTDTQLKLDEAKSPTNTLSLRSHVDLADDWEIDNILYYVDDLKSIGVEDYLRLDARLGWSPRSDFDVSLVGQNLLDNYHQEFSAPLQGVAAEIPRSVLVRAAYRF